MEPYQQRVVDEKEDLHAKCARLAAFIEYGQAFPTLAAEEQVRLRRQLVVMREYAGILIERIAAFQAGATV
jgi:hypothetical protein